MVKRSLIFGVVIVVVLAISAAYYIESLNNGGGGVTIDMEVTSGTPQNGAPDHFLPANFTVTEGEKVTIVFDNTDDGPHRLQIPALGVDTGPVQGGQTVRVTFVPERVGTFEYDQPQGSCYDQQNPAVSCTGAQETNGEVTVLPPGQ
jgi:plastocyanin